MIVIVQYIKRSLPSNVESGAFMTFEFQDSNGYIELLFVEEQNRPYNGWSIIPHSVPSRVCVLLHMILIAFNILQISKHIIDRFCTILYVY